MAYSLARWPEARRKVKEELAVNLDGPLTFSSIRDLPYTYAFLKEVLRRAGSADCTLLAVPHKRHDAPSVYGGLTASDAARPRIA